MISLFGLFNSQLKVKQIPLVDLEMERLESYESKFTSTTYKQSRMHVIQNNQIYTIELSFTSIEHETFNVESKIMFHKITGKPIK